MQTKMIKLSALLAVAIPNVTLATDIAAVATVVTQRAELQNPTINSVTTKLNSLRDNLSQAHPTKALTEIKEDLLILQDDLTNLSSADNDEVVTGIINELQAGLNDMLESLNNLLNSQVAAQAEEAVVATQAETTEQESVEVAVNESNQAEATEQAQEAQEDQEEQEEQEEVNEQEAASTDLQAAIAVVQADLAVLESDLATLSAMTNARENCQENA